MLWGELLPVKVFALVSGVRLLQIIGLCFDNEGDFGEIFGLKVVGRDWKRKFVAGVVIIKMLCGKILEVETMTLFPKVDK